MADPPKGPADLAATTRRSVLVADDNPANRILMVRVLQRAGMDVETVADGHAAVAALSDQSFDAVLMDIQMPGMDGLEAIRAIRASSVLRIASIPIVAVTAHAASEDRRAALAAGADAFVAKPFIAAKLVDAVRQTLEQSKAEY